MANASDRWTQLESDVSSSFERMKAVVQSGSIELEQLWSKRMSAVRASIESDITRLNEEMELSADAAKAEAVKRFQGLSADVALVAAEAAAKQNRAAKRGLLGWMAVLLVSIVVTWWLSLRARATWDDLSEARKTYRSERATYELMQRHGVRVIESPERYWIQLDRSARTMAVKDGTRWLLLKR